MEPIQAARKILRKNGPAARRCQSQKNKTPRSPRSNGTYDFLKQRFEPVPEVEIPSPGLRKRIENSFYNSLNNLSSLYGFTPLPSTNNKFPFNITQSFAAAKKEVAKKEGSLNLIILQENQQYPVLATVKEMNTGLTLYYVPLDALWQLHCNRNKPAFFLLISIYAYLHQTVGMALCKEGNYVGDTYHMMKESYENEEGDMDAQDYKESLQAFAVIDRVSPILNREIANKIHLRLFESRIQAFRTISLFDENLLEIATRFFELYSFHPDKSFAKNYCSEFLYEEEEERAIVEQYFSFCWSLDGGLIDQLNEWVNCDLQEKSVFDLPISIQRFDTPLTATTHDFEFETQLLNLVCQLADLLN